MKIEVEEFSLEKRVVKSWPASPAEAGPGLFLIREVPPPSGCPLPQSPIKGLAYRFGNNSSLSWRFVVSLSLFLCLMQELEKSLANWTQNLKELQTMKSDLTQHILAEDVMVLKEQIELLHRQWEDLCLRVSRFTAGHGCCGVYGTVSEGQTK